MKKGTSTLMLTLYYLVDKEGNVFTTAVPTEDTIVEVVGLVDKNDGEAFFHAKAKDLKEFCRTRSIHYATEEQELQFSTAVMTDVEQDWVVNITCWRQKELKGACLMQPKHLIFPTKTPKS